MRHIEIIEESFNQILTESRGLFARNLGDPFVDDKGTLYSFQGLQTYPDIGSYNSSVEVAKKVDELQKALKKIKIAWVNNQGSNRAFAIAKFEGNNQVLYYGRFFREISNNMIGTWDNTDLPGLKLGTKTGKKAESAEEFKPKNLIGTEEQYTTDELIEVAIHNSVSPNVKKSFRLLNKGQFPLIIPGEAERFEAVRDVLGEIFQPIALQKGLCIGDAIKAEKTLLQGERFKDCTISFPLSDSHGLVDSYLHSPDGMKIGISSKGGLGAAASMANLRSAIEDAREENSKLLKTHNKFVHFVDLVFSEKAAFVPLTIAREWEWITDNDVKQCINSVKLATKTTAGLTKNLAKEYNEYFSRPGVQGSFNKPGFSAGNMIIASLAGKIAIAVNKEKWFNKGAIAFLNQTNMMQIYTKARKKGPDVEIYEFNAVYPAQFKGTIELNPYKTYMSTGNKGHFTFIFKK